MRRIITKLIIRVGVDKVKSQTPSSHIALVQYVERARRKKQNARERSKMLALLGQKSTPKRDEKANPEDSSADSDPDEDDADAEGDNDSDASDSDSEEEDNLNLKEGVDTLQSSNRLDIPVVTDIPVVSQLAKA